MRVFVTTSMTSMESYAVDAVLTYARLVAPTAHRDRERFAEVVDGVQDPAGVGIDDRDGVAAVVGHDQPAAIGANIDVADRTVLHRNLDHRSVVELEDSAISIIVGGL